jgi:hypothetical protein
MFIPAEVYHLHRIERAIPNLLCGDREGVSLQADAVAASRAMGTAFAVWQTKQTTLI